MLKGKNYLRLVYLLFWAGVVGFQLFVLHGYYKIPFFSLTAALLLTAFLFLLHFIYSPGLRKAFWHACFLPSMLNITVVLFLADTSLKLFGFLFIGVATIFFWRFLRKSVDFVQKEINSAMNWLIRGVFHRFAPVFYRDERGAAVGDLNRLCAMQQERELMCQYVSPDLWAEMQKDSSSQIASARELAVVSLLVEWGASEEESEVVRMERFFVITGDLCKKYSGFLNALRPDCAEIFFFADREGFQKQAVSALSDLQGLCAQFSDAVSVVLRQGPAKSGLVHHKHGFRYRIFADNLRHDLAFLRQSRQDGQTGFYIHKSFYEQAERFFHMEKNADGVDYARIGGEKDLQFHLSNLKSPRVEDRLMSMRVIESHRHAEAIPTLLELLEDVSPRVRVVSARVLSTLAVGGNESLIGRALLASLSKEWNHEVRATIIISLGELRKKEFLSPLLPLLHDENDRVRANAIEAVGRSMERRIILRHLEAMLKDKNNRARANAALAIWVMGEKSGFKELLHMAASEDPLMCCSGLFGIGEVFAEANMRILTDFISDPVAFYTGEQKSLFQPAFELCVKGLAFPHKLVERNAVLALKKMKTMLCVPLLTQKYGETDDDFVRQLIIETLLSLELFAQAAALKGGIVSSVAEGNKA